MTKINRVVFNGKAFKLAIPVYLSDDEVEFAKKTYDSERASALANAAFVFSIIQQQIEELNDGGEVNNEDQP